MICMRTGEQVILILEPSSIASIKCGVLLITPDNKILIAYSPDLDWTVAELKEFAEGGDLDISRLDAIIKEGLKRPDVLRL